MKQYDNALAKGTILQGTSCQYQIEEVLGQGSFGITYLAAVKIVGALGTMDANQKVAIKEFFMGEINQRTKEGTVEGMTKGSLSYKYKQRFHKEAENISKLNHPNIVKVVDFIEANETSYYVMEYIDGEDLLHYMNDKPLPTDEAIRIITEVGKALTYMHEEKNMLHLDLKPGNIMRRKSDGHIFLIDFGLTKIYADDGRPETSTTIGLGTPGYAPLEQSNKNSLKPTIDVYALGATLLKLLTAEPIPPAPDVFNDDELLDSIMSKHRVNENVKNAIIQSMEPKPKARLQSVKAFVKVLSATSSAKEKNSDATIFDSEVGAKTNSEEVYDKDSVGLFREGFAKVKGYNGKYGFIDKTGSLIIPCQWNDVMPFSEGLAGVMDEHFMWGFVNMEGIVVLPCKWKAIGEFSDGRAKVKDRNGDWIDIDKSGQRIKSYIEINSEPVGANVTIDEKRIGTTPNIFEVTPGNHQVTVSNGDSWCTFTQNVVVEKGKTIQVYAQLFRNVDVDFDKICNFLNIRQDNKKSYIDVVTNAKGASVTIDGEWTGTAPNKFEVMPGEHQVIVSNGTDWSTFYNSVVVEKGETTQLHAQLTRKSFVEVKSEPPGANVFIDGARRGTTPNKFEVTPGRHNIKGDFGNDYYESVSDSFFVTEGESLPITFRFVRKKEKESPQPIAIPNDILLPQVVQLLKEGHTVILPCKGDSMTPTIRDGEKCLLKRNDSYDINDIVLTKVSDHYIVARIINKSADGSIILRGDANISKQFSHMSLIGGRVDIVYDVNGNARNPYSTMNNIRSKISSWMKRKKG